MNSLDSPAIELVGLTKSFGDVKAVDAVSLVVPRGTTLGLIGPNGAGKSTTIRILMGLSKVTYGTVRVLGLDPALDAPQIKSRVGYVPETHLMYRWMRIADLIWFAKSFYPTWNDKLCGDLVKLFGLNLRQKIKQLSKGTLAKVSLLLAVAHEPELLILDEPMSGLDPLAREEIVDGVLRIISERQCSVLFSSHSLGDVQRMADNVAMLYEGKLLVHCPVDELLTSAKRVRAVLRDGFVPTWRPPEAIWQSVERREWQLTLHPCSEQLIARLQAECPVDNIELADLSLEDLFKDYVKGRRTSI